MVTDGLLVRVFCARMLLTLSQDGWGGGDMLLPAYAAGKNSLIQVTVKCT